MSDLQGTIASMVLVFCVMQIERAYGVYPGWVSLNYFCQVTIVCMLVMGFQSILNRLGS